MWSRLPSWILLVYLAIDLANPFVPGAFRFTPEEGVMWVEAASHVREVVEADVVAGKRAGPAPIPRPVPDGGELRAGGPIRAWHLTAWLAGVRTSDAPARDWPPPDSDDH